MPHQNHLPLTAFRHTIGRILAALGLKERATVAYRKWFMDRDYQRWIRKVERRQSSTTLNKGPLISVIVPCHKYVGHYFLEMLGSVQTQTYQQWELVIVNACDRAEDAQQIAKAIQGDERVRQVRLEKNLHISANTNAGIAAAKGDYLAFLDYDDILAPSALADVALTIVANPEIDALYSDEDKLSDRGDLRYYPFFKPNFNEEQFLTSNFVTHFSVMRTSLVRELGGLRVGFEGSQDYDLWLRVYEKTSNIAHIPKMNYHWRIAEGSTAGTVASKNYASDAGKKALNEHLLRRGISATVSDFSGQPSTYRVSYNHPIIKKIILVSDDEESVLSLRGILPTITIDRVELKDLESSALDDDTYLVFYESGVVISNPQCIQGLIAKASQQGIGFVSANVKNEDGVSLMGYVLQDKEFMPLYSDNREQTFGYDGLNCVPRPFLIVGSKLGVIGARAFRKIEDKYDYKDGQENICLLAYMEGYRNVYWPVIEAKTMTRNNPGLLSPSDKILESLSLSADPYINQNLVVRKGKLIPRL